MWNHLIYTLILTASFAGWNKRIGGVPAGLKSRLALAHLHRNLLWQHMQGHRAAGVSAAPDGPTGCLFPVCPYHNCMAANVGIPLMVNAAAGALDTDALENKYGTCGDIVYRPMG